MGAFDPGGEREPDGRGREPFAPRLLSSRPGSGGDVRLERSRLRYPKSVLNGRAVRQRSGSGRVQSPACSVVSTADTAEPVEAALIHSTGDSNCSIISLDEHRIDTVKAEIIVMLHRQRAATLDAGDEGAIRNLAGAGAVAFLMNRRCRSGEDVGARASSVTGTPRAANTAWESRPSVE